jgi:hypothetical protein
MAPTVGFSYEAHGNEVVIYHRGRRTATLRAESAPTLSR